MYAKLIPKEEIISGTKSNYKKVEESVLKQKNGWQIQGNPNRLSVQAFWLVFIFKVKVMLGCN